MSHQTLLFDNRIALLKENDENFEVVNCDDITIQDSSNLISSGKCNGDRKHFEKEVKNSYRIKKVKWVN